MGKDRGLDSRLFYSVLPNGTCPRVGMKKKKQVIDENVEYFLREGTLPNGIQPIVMNNVGDYLRSQGAIGTQELLVFISTFFQEYKTNFDLPLQTKTSSL